MKKSALEVVYEKYSREVYLYAFSLCKDYHLAQDLVSDTFFKALLSIKDDNIEIKYWLFRVCKNLWLDDLKYRKHFTNAPLELNDIPTEDNIIIKLIDNELEKNEAINDYLAENLDLNSICDDNLTTATNFTTKKIKHTVNRKLAKIVAISVALVFIIIFSVKYIVSPLVASQYYSPTTQTLDNYDQDFLYDLRALNELINPGYGITMAYAEDKSFGKYNLIYDSTNLFTTETSHINMQITRNKRLGIYQYIGITSSLMSSALWKNPRDDDAYQGWLSIESSLTEDKINHLKELSPTNYVSAYVHFKNDLNMDEMQSLIDKYNNINFNWAAIRVSSDRVRNPIGFRINTGGDTSSGDISYYKQYPALVLNDYYFNDPESQGENGLIPGYSKHFRSLLKYLSDNNDAVKALSNFDLNFNEYISYINDNGVNTYGMLIFATPSEILSLYENEDILTIDINNVLPSIYSTKYIN